MRTLLGLLSAKSVWSLTLLAIVGVFTPQTVLASENANTNQAFEFSGVYNLADEHGSTMISAPMITTTQKSALKTEQPKPKTSTIIPSTTRKNPPKNTPPLAAGERLVSISSYTSSPEETQGNPFITASGAHVHMGTAAWNGVPFGTKFMIPDLTGDMIYTVEDRGSMRVMGTTTIDLWRPTKAEAFAIGRRHGVRIVIVE